MCFCISSEKPKWLRISPKDYKRLLLKIKKDKTDDIIRKIVEWMGVEGDLKLKRRIRNFARSFIVPDKKVI